MTIDPELPWGYWFHLEKRDGTGVFVDEATGTTWPSLRAALWNGRLGMPDHNRQPPPELLELVHAVLAATVRRRLGDREQDADLFEGSHLFRRMFHLWLGSTGLVILDDNGHGPIAITAEGMTVLHMLTATRPHDVRQSRPSAATVAMLTELGLGPENRSARFERLDREAVRWDAAFLRRQEGRQSTIILSKRGSGPVPVMQTVWSLAFDNARQRDFFYEWLCHRLDRWQAWAELASQYGSHGLTHKLLAVLAASLDEGEEAALAPKVIS